MVNWCISTRRLERFLMCTPRREGLPTPFPTVGNDRVRSSRTHTHEKQTEIAALPEAIRIRFVIHFHHEFGPGDSSHELVCEVHPL